MMVGRGNGRLAGRYSFILGMGMAAFMVACGGDDSSTGTSAGGASGSSGSGGSAGSSAGSSGSAGSAGAGATAGSAGTAGTAGSSGSAGASAGDLPCALSDMLASRCGQCHGSETKFGAPMSLVTKADLEAAGVSDKNKSVLDLVLERTDSNAKSIMPPAPNSPLTADERKLIQDWVDGGKPTRAAGEMCQGAGGSGGGGGQTAACEGTEVNLVPDEPWKMDQSTADEYICFGIDVDNSQGEKKHITQIAPVIDNTKILHHMLLYVAPESYSKTPKKCAGLPNTSWKLYYGWGPGTPPHVLPKEAGFPIDKGQVAHYVVQVHLSNLNAEGDEQDKSGLKICTTDKVRQFDADVLATGSTSFSLPPHQTSSVDCSFSVPNVPGLPSAIHAFQAWPHMHLWGAAMESDLTKAGSSTPFKIVDVPKYDFYNQIPYPISLDIGPGDKVRTKCTWNNMSNKTVSFGENTEDEMCFNFIAYYPRITFPGWQWALPSAAASCSQ